ncbi:hypothetical protein ACFVUB_27700 [Streptomyces niveus]|uniref:hypothetical protein n=1 Tax=Streptomyces niveus TaxID=193462 RepID=UPI0036DBDC06
MDARLFGLLSEGQVEEYRAIAHAKRHTRPQLARDKKWGGPVSPKKLGFFQAAEPEHAPPGGLSPTRPVRAVAAVRAGPA